jgi:hypothetical protein
MYSACLVGSRAVVLMGIRLHLDLVNRQVDEQPFGSPDADAFIDPFHSVFSGSHLAAYSNATPIRNSVRRTTRQQSFNPSSSTINVNFAGMTVESNSSIDAPVIDRSRTVHFILSPPCSITAGFVMR